jgi:protein-S-isoprenylcysteine O-methyltransferase Ste14
MNMGEVMAFLALAAWFNSLALLTYAFVAWLAFHLFVVFYEEPRLARRFGDRYDAYRRDVGRWVPKVGALG